MTKWRRGIGKVLTDLEQVLVTYEGFIQNRKSDDEKQTFDDVLEPNNPPKPKTKSDTRGRWFYLKEREMNELVGELENPELSGVVRKSLEKTYKKIRQDYIKTLNLWVTEMEMGMVSRSNDNWTETSNDQKKFRIKSVVGHPLNSELGKEPNDTMTLKEVFEVWYDGQNPKWNDKLKKNRDTTKYGDKKSVPHFKGEYELKRTKVLPNPHLSKKGLVDEISDLGTGWLYENYHIPFVLEERKVSREKIKEVPEEIIHHRNMVLEILREIEDYMEDEFNKTRPNDYHPTEPTPYHKPNRLRVDKKEIQSFKDEVGEYEERGWRDIIPRVRRTHRKS
jgi:hypothetical protein